VNTSFPETSTDTSFEIPDTVAAINMPRLLSLTFLTAAAVKNLELALIPATIEGLKVTALLDTGASDVCLSAEKFIEAWQRQTPRIFNWFTDIFRVKNA